jgi:hypothetical protein
MCKFPFIGIIGRAPENEGTGGTMQYAGRIKLSVVTLSID